MRLEVNSIRKAGIPETTSKIEQYRYTRRQDSRNGSREYPHNWANKSCAASIFDHSEINSVPLASAFVKGQTSAQKHLFVGTDIRESHACRISYLRATERRAFWATHGRRSDVASNSYLPRSPFVDRMPVFRVRCTKESRTVAASLKEGNP
jgi:hypothetical protein